MKIALIHNQFIERGGMERYLASLVKGFTDYGDTVTVLTGRFDPAAPLADRCRTVLTDLSWIPRPLRARVFAARVARLVHQLDCDVSISLTRTWGQDVTVCGGTHRAFLHYMKKRRTPAARGEIRREQRAYDTSRRIVAHSRLLRDEIIRLYDILDKKVTVIHPPTDTDRFKPVSALKRTELRSRFGMVPNRLCLVFVSTGHRRKGLYPLLDAMALLPQDRFELVVVGSPAPEAERISNARHLGYVRDVDEVYAAADFTILPAYYEPFGLVITESLLCGTPVLISKRVGAADLITESEGRIFPEVSPQSIADTILEAADLQFTVAPDFAERHCLTLPAHIEKLRETITTA